MDRKVFVFGAGATKACGGPLTKDVLQQAFTSLPASMPLALAPLNDFLCEVFRLPSAIGGRKASDYPPLPSLLTFIDTALARNEDVTTSWTCNRLPSVRAAIEHAIFLSLGVSLERVSRNYYHELFMAACPDDAGPTAISLNYDTLADRAMIELSHWAGAGNLPDYGCRLVMPGQGGRFGRLLKLHGSVDWMHCRACSELRYIARDFDIYKQRIPAEFVDMRSMDKPSLVCRRCGHPAHACIVAPSQRKTYGSAELNDVWHEAERVLRAASHVYFIGYSLPEDDVEIALLLRRSLELHSPARITVVEHDEKGRGAGEHEVGKRYSSLFGEVDWFPHGFAAWLEHRSRSGGWPE